MYITYLEFLAFCRRHEMHFSASTPDLQQKSLTGSGWDSCETLQEEFGNFVVT